MTEAIDKIEYQYVGIDIAKNSLEVAFETHSKTHTYANTTEGIAKLLEKIKSIKHALVVLEPTGGYEGRLEQACLAAGVVAVSVLANRVRHFAKSQGQLAKNDALDATMLLRYGKTFLLTQANAKMQNSPYFKALVTRRDQVVRMIAREKNHLETTFDNNVEVYVKEMMEALKKQLKAIEKELETLIKQDENMSEKATFLKTIKGAGDVTILTCLAYLPELGLVSNKEIAALVGVAPYARDSGEYRGQRRIMGGRANVRRVLYMAALTAIRCNQSIKATYQHLKKQGKATKVAIVACMRKLIIMMNCICKEMRPWVEKSNA